MRSASAIERLLADYGADLDRTAQMCAALARLQILAPFTMQVMEGNRAAFPLEGCTASTRRSSPSSSPPRTGRWSRRAA